MSGTTIQQSGCFFHITTLGPPEPADSSMWEYANSYQLGVLGSDYREIEPIGSAAFQRSSHSSWIPDNINFWYPQIQPRDHRPNPYFKRTCIGAAHHVDVTDVDATYKDQDVCIYITPDPPYQYLITEGHAREYTWIMKAQWRAKQLGLVDTGHSSCDDTEAIEDSKFVEAEIQPSSDLNSGVAEALRDRIAAADNKMVGVYGPWIYDMGHCCHAEIHPAEQIWWRQDTQSGATYHLNVICDASKRFWWRNQMDDGTKLKPWGAPPIAGVFAIPFEVALPGPALASPLEFVVTTLGRHNAATMSNCAETQLIHNGETLVKFVPNGDWIKASFERVGLVVVRRGVGGFRVSLIRGFLVLETSVGSLNQIQVDSQFPAGTDVNAINEDDESRVFDKQEGHLMFSVSGRQDNTPVINP